MALLAGSSSLENTLSVGDHETWYPDRVPLDMTLYGAMTRMNIIRCWIRFGGWLGVSGFGASSVGLVDFNGAFLLSVLDCRVNFTFRWFHLCHIDLSAGS